MTGNIAGTTVGTFGNGLALDQFIPQPNGDYSLGMIFELLGDLILLAVGNVVILAIGAIILVIRRPGMFILTLEKSFVILIYAIVILLFNGH